MKPSKTHRLKSETMLAGTPVLDKFVREYQAEVRKRSIMASSELEFHLVLIRQASRCIYAAPGAIRGKC